LHGDVILRDLRGKVTVAVSQLEEVGEVHGERMNWKVKVIFENPPGLWVYRLPSCFF
jgi:hypothetical protein